MSRAAAEAALMQTVAWTASTTSATSSTARGDASLPRFILTLKMNGDSSFKRMHMLFPTEEPQDIDVGMAVGYHRSAAAALESRGHGHEVLLPHLNAKATLLASRA